MRAPRTPGYRSIIRLASSTLQPLTRSSASIRGTATSSGWRRAMSNAVRAGVVTHMSPTRQTSRLFSASLYTLMPLGRPPIGPDQSAGSDASSQRLPSTAAALWPASVADRPDHSHAAMALLRAVRSTPRMTWTLRKSLRYSRSSSRWVNLPEASASLATTMLSRHGRIIDRRDDTFAHACRVIRRSAGEAVRQLHARRVLRRCRHSADDRRRYSEAATAQSDSRSAAPDRSSGLSTTSVAPASR